MGQTIRLLAKREIDQVSIFHHRFVIELCESVHVHYRNLRIALSLSDWIRMAEGFRDALRRWEDRGKLEVKDGTHIELCRKEIVKQAICEPSIKVNLNRNLYQKHDGRIFSDGAGFDEPEYIHLKIRDLRLEMSIEEFNQLALAVEEAKEKLVEKII